MRQEPKIPGHDEEEENGGSRSSITNVAGPVSSWIILLFIALTIKFVVSSGTMGGSSAGSIDSWLAIIANFILGTPGEIILPLVIGAAIGDEVGAKSETLRKAEKSGLLNGVYASVIYLIGIIIIYEVLTGILPNAAPTFSILITSWIAMPILICIVLSEVFAILSHSRKIND